MCVDKKEFTRKNGTKYSLIQFRVTPEERRKLAVLCASLGIGISGFFRRLMRGALPEGLKGDEDELEK